AFDYRADGLDGEALAGCRVRVPFGRGELIGIVLGAGEADQQGLKPVIDVLDAAPVFVGELWRTLLWAAGYYHFPVGEVLGAALPAVLRAGAPWPSLDEPGLALSPAGAEALAGGRLRAGPGRIVLQALADGPLGLAQLRLQLGPSAGAAIRRLRQRGWVEETALRPARVFTPPLAGPALHPEQQAVVDAVDLDGGFQGHLLQGVTGSGKTEVYLQLVARVLERGRQALVLVPEIALTPQALRRYRERLAAQVLPLHSGLGERERARAWAMARAGEPCVVLGTRS